MVSLCLAPRKGSADTSRPDLEQVVRWLRLLIEPGQVAELRAIRRRRGSVTGYFDDGHLYEMAKTGIELSLTGDFKGVYVGLNPVRPDLLHRSPYRVGPLSEAASDTDILRRRWLLVDVDPRRPGTCSATAEEKKKAEDKILEIRAFLAALGWAEPILADSGNGFHLLFRVDEPVDDGGLVKGVLRALADRFDDYQVEIDRKVYNASRITKLYGSKACKGDETADRPHRWTAVLEVPDELKVVSRKQLEALAGPATTQQVNTASKSEPVDPMPSMPLHERAKRARAYVAKMPPAVEGHGGDKQTYTVACVLVRDFALSVEQALPLLAEYNERCQPPWEVDDLVRKLEAAMKKRPSEQERQGSTPPLEPVQVMPPAQPPAGQPFSVDVPDFLGWDRDQVRPRQTEPEFDKRQRRLAGRVVPKSWLNDLVRCLLIQQRRSPVVIPDVVLGELVWGPRTATPWPRNWRRTLQGCGFAFPPGECPETCPFHGRPAPPHGHLLANLGEAFLGVMSAFYCGVDQDGRNLFDFGNRLNAEEAAGRKADLGEEIIAREQRLETLALFDPDGLKEAKAELKAVKKLHRHTRSGSPKVPSVRAVYWPIRIFGPSPRSKLTAPQCDIISALTGEITRARGRTDRRDKAEVVSQDVCPYLQTGQGYVQFNGNADPRGRKAHLHGYGFKVGTWVKKAGSGDETAFLRDVRTLAEPFGLIVAGYDKATEAWKAVDELVELRRSEAGRAWLNGCVLRIYTAADYLPRWRRLFAKRLGFSHIPGGEERHEERTPSPIAAEATSVITSKDDLATWMRQKGLTDGKLAELMGVGRVTVNHYRTGRRRWSPKFQDLLTNLLTSGAV